MAPAALGPSAWATPAGAIEIDGDFGDEFGGPASICRREIAEAEANRGIPRGLLASIAMVESGRWDARRRAASAWPWTVTARGVGNFYRTKEEAAAAVGHLRNEGVGNIDVGCMQVNLRYHPAAFANLDDALDPAKNVAYGADFLVRLRSARGSWRKAVAHYHSATPSHYRPYTAKVFRAWADARRRMDGERRDRRAVTETASRAAGRAEREARREAWKANLRNRRTRFAAWIAGRLTAKTGSASGKISANQGRSVPPRKIAARIPGTSGPSAIRF